MNNEQVEFKPQKEFPYYNQYKQKFQITEHTIFVYKNKIYSNKTEEDWKEYYDVLHHELEHIRSQNEIGPENWIQQFLNNKEFRVNEEKRAYLYQLKKVKELGDKTDLMNIFTEVCQNISSDLYGKMISYREAEKYFKENI